MKQEYTDKMNTYQSKEYEGLLQSKNVLNARQFLHSSMLHLNYAVITAKLYEDAGKKNIQDGNNNPMYNGIEIMDWTYNAQTFLNKCALEWIFHVANALDCLWQYVNAAMNLGIKVKDVSYNSLEKKLQGKVAHAECDSLNNDSVVTHIRAINNYSKHTLALYGLSSFESVFTGQKDVKIPSFRYRGNSYPEKELSEFIGYYETFIGKYLLVLDTVNAYLIANNAVPGRYHISGVKINDTLLGDTSDLVLVEDFQEDGVHLENYRLKDVPFSLNGSVEIMMPRSKSIGQHMGYISKIKVLENGTHVADLNISSLPENSTLSYDKYDIVRI